MDVHLNKTLSIKNIDHDTDYGTITYLRIYDNSGKQIDISEDEWKHIMGLVPIVTGWDV